MNVRIPHSITNTINNKHPLDVIGLTTILIFNDSGLPIYSRNYEENTSVSIDDLVLSAFISSLSNFIRVYDEEELHGFSTSKSRFYIKIVDDMIYCLVLNKNVFSIGSGLTLTQILDKTLDELIKSFSIYYRMTRTKDFIEKSFLDVFEKQIDTLLLFNIKNKKILDTSVKNYKSDLYNEISKEFLSETFNHVFLKNGILGLFVLNEENKPVVIRDYVINQKYIKQADYYQRIVLTLKQFNHLNLGTIKDIGIGKTRILLKIIHNYTICLILSEKQYWEHTEDSLLNFSDVLLQSIEDLINSDSKLVSVSQNNKKSSLFSQTIQYSIDKQLHTNLQNTQVYITRKD